MSDELTRRTDIYHRPVLFCCGVFYDSSAAYKPSDLLTCSLTTAFRSIADRKLPLCFTVDALRCWAQLLQLVLRRGGNRRRQLVHFIPILTTAGHNGHSDGAHNATIGYLDYYATQLEHQEKV